MEIVGLTELEVRQLEEYFGSLYTGPVKLLSCRPLGIESKSENDLKGFGYGVPYLIEFSSQGTVRKVVLQTMNPEGFGHEHFSDRAKILLWQHSVFNKLPKHVRSVDVGAFRKDGRSLRSLGDSVEFFIVTEFAEGRLYHTDLDRIKAKGQLNVLDEKRCSALSDYLAEIHSVKHHSSSLYIRRIRELVGHAECIMGLLDSYPRKSDFYQESQLIDIELSCVSWRWWLKRLAHRLSQVHGDFHPWNILFQDGVDFKSLDRSRGEWGEPADDVASLSINFLFYSLRKHKRLAGSFERLFEIFWENYLSKTSDHEILNVIQPFYAWRALVLASPIWYPSLNTEIRAKLLNFARNILQVKKLDLKNINSYCEKA